MRGGKRPGLIRPGFELQIQHLSPNQTTFPSAPPLPLLWLSSLHQSCMAEVWEKYPPVQFPWLTGDFSLCRV